MKGEDILFAMNTVKKEYIQEAGEALHRARIIPRRRRVLRTLLIAAIIAAFMGVSAYAAGGRVLEIWSLRQKPELQDQAEQGAIDLARFTGLEPEDFTVRDQVQYEDGDQGQTEVTTYFYNCSKRRGDFWIDYYANGDIHLLGTRDYNAPLDLQGYDSRLEYFKALYADPLAYKARVEAAGPAMLDALHADGWVKGSSEHIARVYLNEHHLEPVEYEGECLNESYLELELLMDDDSAYSLWFKVDDLSVADFLYFTPQDMPNTRNGLFQALKDGTEEVWWEWLQSPDNGAVG